MGPLIAFMPFIAAGAGVFFLFLAGVNFGEARGHFQGGDEERRANGNGGIHLVLGVACFVAAVVIYFNTRPEPAPTPIEAASVAISHTPPQTNGAS